MTSSRKPRSPTVAKSKASPSSADTVDQHTAAKNEHPAVLPKGKLGIIVALLRRPGGADLQELMDATGWQAHSVRGAIAGAIKKKLKLTVSSEKVEHGRVYRIVDEAA